MGRSGTSVPEGLRVLSALRCARCGAYFFVYNGRHGPLAFDAYSCPSCGAGHPERLPLNREDVFLAYARGPIFAARSSSPQRR